MKKGAPGPASVMGGFEGVVVAGWNQCGGTKQRGFIPVKSLTSLCQHLSSIHFGSTVAMSLFAWVVVRSSRPTTSSTDTRGLCVASITTGRAFETFPCGERKTFGEIILNLNVSGEEEGKRTIMASSRKRADILDHLNWKSIVFVNQLVM